MGTASYDDDPSNGAKLIDQSGQQFEPDMVESINAGVLMPSSVTLPTGGSALGFVVFQVPSGSHVTKVQFGMDSGFAETGEWTV